MNEVTGQGRYNGFKTATLVTGGNSGLGLAIVNAMEETPQWFPNILAPSEDDMDVRKVNSILDYRIHLESQGLCVRQIVNCAGVNRINFLRDLSEDDWNQCIDTNAKGIMLMAREFLPHLQAAPTPAICNITSNAAHCPMTASLAYNASKAAAEIITKQLARELTPSHGITVFGVSPNKMSGTGMTQYIDKRVCWVRGWTPEYAREYQLKSLLAGEETDPDCVAEFIAFLLRQPRRHKYLTGCIIPYGL